MRFLIFGAGALGQALGCMLAADGHRVDLVLRARFIEAIDDAGLQVSGIFGEFSAPLDRVGLLSNLEGVDGAGYDYGMITTKAYDTETAVQALAGLPGFDGPVVSMQNGCGNVEKVAMVFGEERTLGARVITGFEIPRPGLVRITATADDIHIGSVRPGHIPESAAHLAEAINHAGLPCIAVEDIHRDLFAKLLYNCALNPLGALLGVHYGALGDHGETRRVMDRIMDETFDVIETMGGSTPWPDAEAYRRVFYDHLLPLTRNHRPSMLQDLENGKRTEVDALVGYVAEQGHRLGVETPTCDTLAALIRFRESQVLADREVQGVSRAKRSGPSSAGDSFS